MAVEIERFARNKPTRNKRIDVLFLAAFSLRHTQIRRAKESGRKPPANRI